MAIITTTTRTYLVDPNTLRRDRSDRRDRPSRDDRNYDIVSLSQRNHRDHHSHSRSSTPRSSDRTPITIVDTSRHGSTTSTRFTPVTLVSARAARVTNTHQSQHPRSSENSGRGRAVFAQEAGTRASRTMDLPAGRIDATRTCMTVPDRLVASAPYRPRVRFANDVPASRSDGSSAFIINRTPGWREVLDNRERRAAQVVIHYTQSSRDRRW